MITLSIDDVIVHFRQNMVGLTNSFSTMHLLPIPVNKEIGNSMLNFVSLKGPFFFIRVVYIYMS